MRWLSDSIPKKIGLDCVPKSVEKNCALPRPGSGLLKCVPAVMFCKKNENRDFQNVSLVRSGVLRSFLSGQWGVLG